MGISTKFFGGLEGTSKSLTEGLTTPKQVKKFFSSPNESATEAKQGKGRGWKLVDINQKDLFFESPFMPSEANLNWTSGAQWEEISALGTEHPTLQFLKGNAETLSLGGMIISKRSNDVDTKLAVLQKMETKNPKTGHPSICFFSYGQLSKVCVITSLNIGKMYTSPAKRTLIVEFTIGLKRFVQPPQRLLLPKKQIPFPLWKTVYMKKGETFEILAKHHYKDVRLGNKLRKLYPKHEPVTEPKKVDLPPPEWLHRNEKPDSHIFDKDNDALKKVKLNQVNKKQGILKDNSFKTRFVV